MTTEILRQSAQRICKKNGKNSLLELERGFKELIHRELKYREINILEGE